MPPGAGCSGATFTLAASLAGLALVVTPGARTATAVALIAADGATLLALGDAHGVTMLVGITLGALVATIRRHAVTTTDRDTPATGRRQAPAWPPPSGSARR
jgi:hypothetical protein